MVLYDEFAAFCNETGELMPETITKETSNEESLLIFCQFLHDLINERGNTPCTIRPEVVDPSNNEIYTSLVRQWYTKPAKIEDDEPVVITFKWTKKADSKIFDISCPFVDAMTLTDLLGSTLDMRSRLAKIRNWIVDHGKKTPNDTDTFAILDGEKVLYFQL